MLKRRLSVWVVVLLAGQALAAEGTWPPHGPLLEQGEPPPDKATIELVSVVAPDTLGCVLRVPREKQPVRICVLRALGSALLFAAVLIVLLGWPGGRGEEGARSRARQGRLGSSGCPA